MKKVYIVAEISQNHNGDIKIAKQLIEDARLAECDAVKLNKRHLPHELTEEAWDRPYDSPNSFGPTYGAHRSFLEFNEVQHRELKKYAENRGLDYLLSVCDIPSLEFALSLKPKLIKIPSKEITNLPLLERAAEIDIPVAFSIGLANNLDIERAMFALGNRADDILVICTSEYPTELDNVHLNRLKAYPQWKKGFSSHTPDPALAIAAVALGAEYIEFHITLDREMKGSDHVVALELEELIYMVNCIRDIEIALGCDRIWEHTPSFILPVKKKLMKKRCEDGIWRIH